jgi:hypothetical protein
VAIKLLSVFAFGMIGLWEGIPAGFALRLHPMLVGTFSAAGSLSAALLVLILGERLRSRLVRPPRDENAPRKERLIDRVWRRWGIIGLGLASPGLVGAPLGVALGLFLRAPAGRLLWWTLLGILLWTVTLTILGVLGTAGLLHLLHR